MPRIALVGDHDPTVVAHQAIPRALALARRPGLTWHWAHTATLTGDVAAHLEPFDAVWVVPASPYANTAGAIAAIRFARASARPFLGTCGGFQHALLEYAESAWGVVAPAHAELDPSAPHPVIAPLACGLVETHGEIAFEPGSRLAAWHGTAGTVEGYHCNYGLSPDFTARLAAGPLRVAARDRDGDVRAVELDGHPFFVATLYQPERAALAGRRHPLIDAFVEAAAAHAARRTR